MTDMFKKKCLMSLMQIKTTIKYHSTSITMSASKRQKTMGAGKDTKNRKPLYIVRPNGDQHGHHGEQHGGSSRKLEIRLVFLVSNL